VGQEHIKRALTNAINSDRISHAYLFTGPRGTGKTSTARIFAKSLNCEKGPTVKPCGVCANCIDIANSTPVDVIEIDAASNRSVEDAQNILEKVMYAPVNSRYKIYIIDEVHMLSTTAFNALLKTLEEPPKNVIFILATTEAHKVLDTIKSRCQRFDFKRITTEDISKHLRFIADSEKINITDDALMEIAKNSAGGMRDSIALLDQLSILDDGKSITVEDINLLLGRISFENLKNLVDTIIDSNPAKAIEILNSIYNSGNEPVQILSNLLEYFKNLLIVKTCDKSLVPELTNLNSNQIEEMTSQSIKVEPHQIIFLTDKCADYIKELKMTTTPQLWLEVGIIDLANLTDNTKLAELQNRIARLEGGAVKSVNVSQFKTAPEPIQKIEQKQPVTIPIVQKNEPEVRKAQEFEKIEETVFVEQKTTKTIDSQQDFTPPPMSQKAQPNELGILWLQLIDNVQSVPTRALLMQWANPIKIEKDEVIITLKNEMLLKQFTEGNKRDMLAQAADAMFNQSNTNLIVRLPDPNDEILDVKKKLTNNNPQPQNNVIEKIAESQKAEPTQKEKVPEPVLEIDNEILSENIEDDSKSQEEVYNSTAHSDQVNMVKQLFDGKIMD
jgi:DNA polymerase-3 subunit gamma/tau